MNMKHLYTELNPLVQSGSVTDESITNDSVIEIYFDNTDVFVKTISQSGHVVSFTVDGNLSGTHVCVVVNNLTNVDITDMTQEIVQNTYDIEDLFTSVGDINTTLENHTTTLTTHSNNIIDLQENDTELSQRVEECFQSVSNGKSLIASAITDKGVQTLATDTFQTMADNIGQIQGGEPSELITNRFGNSKTYTITKNYAVGYFYVVSGSSSYVWLRVNGNNQSPIDSENQSYVYIRVYRVYNLKQGDVITTGGYVSSRYFLYNGEV